MPSIGSGGFLSTSTTRHATASGLHQKEHTSPYIHDNCFISNVLQISDQNENFSEEVFNLHKEQEEYLRVLNEEEMLLEKGSEGKVTTRRKHKNFASTTKSDDSVVIHDLMARYSAAHHTDNRSNFISETLSKNRGTNQYPSSSTAQSAPSRRKRKANNSSSSSSRKRSTSLLSQISSSTDDQPPGIGPVYHHQLFQRHSSELEHMDTRPPPQRRKMKKQQIDSMVNRLAQPKRKTLRKTWSPVSKNDMLPDQDGSYDVAQEFAHYFDQDQTYDETAQQYAHDDFDQRDEDARYSDMPSPLEYKLSSNQNAMYNNYTQSTPQYPDYSKGDPFQNNEEGDQQDRHSKQRFFAQSPPTADISSDAHNVSDLTIQIQRRARPSRVEHVRLSPTSDPASAHLNLSSYTRFDESDPRALRTRLEKVEKLYQKYKFLAKQRQNIIEANKVDRQGMIRSALEDMSNSTKQDYEERLISYKRIIEEKNMMIKLFKEKLHRFGGTPLTPSSVSFTGDFSHFPSEETLETETQSSKDGRQSVLSDEIRKETQEKSVLTEMPSIEKYDCAIQIETVRTTDAEQNTPQIQLSTEETQTDQEIDNSSTQGQGEIELMERYDAQIQQWQSRLHAAQGEVKRLQTSFDSREKEFTALADSKQSEICNLNNLVNAKDQQVDRLSDKVKALNDELDQERQKFDAQLQDYEQAILNEKQKLSAATIAQTALDSNLNAEQQEEISSLKTLLKILQVKHDELSSRLQTQQMQHEEDLKQAERKVILPITPFQDNTASQELSKIKRQNADLLSSNEHIRKELETLRMTHKVELKQQKQYMSSESISFRDTITNLERRVEELNAELASKEEQLEEVLKNDLLGMLEDTNEKEISLETSPLVQDNSHTQLISLLASWKAALESGNDIVWDVVEDTHNGLVSSLKEIVEMSRKSSGLPEQPSAEQRKSESFNVPAPPPIPMVGSSMRLSTLPPLPNKRPEHSTKPVLWKKIDNKKLFQTVWIKKELAKDTDSLEFDFKSMEQLFAEHPRVVTSRSTSMERHQKLISLLEDRRRQNISLLLTSLHMSNREIIDAIFRLDHSSLPENVLHKLLTQLPSEDEVDSLYSYDGDEELLDNADVFVRSLQIIPRLRWRLKLWQFKLTFRATKDELEEDIGLFKKACDILLESKKFHEILKILLAAGNFLNGNSRRKLTHGFSLRSLDKFSQIRSTSDDVNPEVSLIFYISRFVKKKHAYLVNFDNEMNAIHEVTEMSLQSIVQDFAKIAKNMDKLEKELVIQRNSPFVEDKFYAVMKEWNEEVRPVFSDLQAQYNSMLTALKRVATFYGEKEEDMLKHPEDFFAPISQFLQDYHEERMSVKSLSM